MHAEYASMGVDNKCVYRNDSRIVTKCGFLRYTNLTHHTENKRGSALINDLRADTTLVGYAVVLSLLIANTAE